MKSKILLSVLVIMIAVSMTVGGTMAYFTDAKPGAITGSVGSIKINAGVNADTGGGLNLTFNNLLPGEPQTVTANYTNTGTSPEDVWIVFSDTDALHALNDLGTYGEVTIASNQKGIVFHSDNLNDKPNNGTYPLLRAIRLSQNVAPGEFGSMTFTFAYASKLGTASLSSGGGVWNSYPLTNPTSNGLPYQIVATQVGQQPLQ